jgi:lipopolysaccharide biosynthesis glycosyltransferase
MQAIIATAADEGFIPLLRGLLDSLHQRNNLPDIAFFDLGLSPSSLELVSNSVSCILTPEWDLPVDKHVKREKPAIRAHTLRPYLPRYLPGYDIYLWIDADAWIQDPSVIQDFLNAAEDNYLAIVPHSHPSYLHTPDIVLWRKTRMAAYFGRPAADRLMQNPYYNAGVVALRADAPHWELWAKWFRVGLETTEGRLFFSDQTALNYAIWMEGLSVNPLPARCNWLCHLALPKYDVKSKTFCDPSNKQKLGILHLTGRTKDTNIMVRQEGKNQQISLRFRRRNDVT